MITLAADIGGTYSRFAIFETEKETLVLRQAHRLLTESARDFFGLVEQLKESELGKWLPRCAALAIAVPGPVRNGNAPNLPNVSWSLDISRVHACFPQTPIDQVHLINDFVAHALACRFSAAAKTICIQRGDSDPDGVLSVIGAGTGMGCCSLISIGAYGHVILPSEAGHTDFAFRPGDEKDYEEFLLKKCGAANIDANMVVSGRGLTLLQSFIIGEDVLPQQVAERLIQESEVCRRFATYYGRIARNYALCVLPTGGLYVTGGVAAKNHFLVNNDAFRNEFSASPAHHELLKQIPLYLNVDEDSGIWGAAYYVAMISKHERKLAACGA